MKEILSKYELDNYYLIFFGKKSHLSPIKMFIVFDIIILFQKMYKLKTL